MMYDSLSKRILSALIRCQQTIETKDETAKDILFRTHLKLSQMDAEYEMSGKNIDEDS